MAQLREQALFYKWIAGYVSASGAAYPSLDALAAAPVPAAGALASFRDFAKRQGADVPSGAEVDSLLGREIVLMVAEAKWGEPARYRVAAALDSDVKAAVGAFDKAGAMLTVGSRE